VSSRSLIIVAYLGSYVGFQGSRRQQTEQTSLRRWCGIARLTISSLYAYLCIATDVLQGSKVKQLRWDHADLLFYYNTTVHLLYPLYYELLEFENVLSSASNAACVKFIHSFYGKLVSCLSQSAELHVPVHYKNYQNLRSRFGIERYAYSETNSVCVYVCVCMYVCMYVCVKTPPKPLNRFA